MTQNSFQDNLVPILETERLLLRGHHIEDFPHSAAMWADPIVVEHISGVPFTKEQSWSRLLRYTGHWVHLGFGYWVVTEKSEGQFIGEVGFADFKRDTKPSLAGKAEAGWAFASAFHGKGYATEAVAAMLSWADEHLEFSATAAMFDPEYSASINVAKKNGFANPVLGHYGEHEVLFMERPRGG